MMPQPCKNLPVPQGTIKILYYHNNDLRKVKTVSKLEAVEQLIFRLNDYRDCLKEEDPDEDLYVDSYEHAWQLLRDVHHGLDREVRSYSESNKPYGPSNEQTSDDDRGSLTWNAE